MGRSVSIISGILLILGLSTGVLWLRSVFFCDLVIVPLADDRFLGLDSQRGSLQVSLGDKLTGFPFSDEVVPRDRIMHESVPVLSEDNSNHYLPLARRWLYGINWTKSTVIPMWAPVLALLAFPLWRRAGRETAREPAAGPGEAIPASPISNPDDEIECPLCGYNLRGISSPRCPECGYQFDWQEILDPTRRVHPYLFEQVKRKPVAAFFKTLTRNFKPNRFWKTLHPSQPLNSQRLFLYALICSIVALSPTLMEAAVSPLSPPRWSATPSWGDAIRMTAQAYRGRIMYVCVVMALYPLGTGLALLLFQQSMRRAKVRAGHVMRCAVYSADSIVWNALWILVALVVEATVWSPYRTLVTMLEFGVLGTVLLTTFRLAAAYRHYMKFPHLFATAVLSQVLLILVVTLCSVPYFHVLFR